MYNALLVQDFFLFVRVCESVCACLCMRVYVCACVCVCMGGCVHVVHLHGCACMCMYVNSTHMYGCYLHMHLDDITIYSIIGMLLKCHRHGCITLESVLRSCITIELISQIRYRRSFNWYHRSFSSNRSLCFVYFLFISVEVLENYYFELVQCWVATECSASDV